ncbi:hypothetical protein [Moorena sp. SIO4G3]|uniref:hypothetical protein n=1 Tax=Moorena sp. SIO4G3 TaxID=2607821 RepID=UPI00142B608D|nr:hypothetical protein [Moorena sp. SIO4G3]NEO76176.1 hypothetical protein [Moorena sp. SIO4G3]
MPTETTQIDISDFDQFKNLMQTVITKLDNFQPGELNKIKAQIAAEDRQIVGLESEISDLSYKLSYISTVQRLDDLEGASDPDSIAERSELNTDAQGLLTALGLTRDTLLDGKTLEEAKAQFEQEQESKISLVKKYKNDRPKLEKQQDKLVSKINRKLQKFNTVKPTIQTQLNSLSSPPTEEQKKALYKSLQTLSKTVPDNTYQRTLTLLDLNARASLSEKITQQIREQLNQQFTPLLSKPGNSQKIQVNLSLGAEFGILSALTGGVTLGGELSYSITVNNDRRIQVENSKLVSLSLGGNLGSDDEETLSASAKLTGDIQSGQKRTYNRIEDFVQAETSRISTAMIQYSANKNPLNLTPFEKLYRQRQALNLREEARQRQSELNDNAQLLGLIDTSDSFTIPPESTVDYRTTNFRAVSGSSELGLNTGFLELGIGRTDKLKLETSSRTINFIDNMLEHRSPSVIYSIKKPEYVNFTIQEGDTETVYQGREGAEKLENLQVGINALKTDIKSNPTLENQYALRELRHELKDALRHLYWEYQEFTQLANRKDSPDSPPEVKERLEKFKKDRGISVKAKIFKGDNVGSRAEYLKAISVQYSQLANLYYDSFPEGQTPLNWDYEFNDYLQDFKTLLKTPQYFIPSDDLNQVFNAKQIALGKEISQAASFTVGGDVISSIAGSLSVEATYTEILKADNEYTEGKGISVEIKLSSTESLQDTIKGVIQQLNSRTNLNIDESIVDATIGNDTVRLEPSLEDGETNKIEFSLAENAGSYYLQYIRISDEYTRDLSAEVPIETGQGVTLKIGGGVGRTATRNRWEFIANNTITYIRDIYTGFKLGERNEDWEKFKTKEESFLRRLFDQLSKENTNAAHEMTDNLNKINKSAVTQAWNTALANYRRDPQGKYGELVSAFDQVMNERYLVFKQNSDERFVNNFRTRDLKEYVNMVLSRAATEFAIEYRVPATVNQDINSLRTWAEAEYANRPSPNKLDILKQVYALDYASNSLNDLLQSPDEIKRKGTTLQLLDDNYIDECRRNPKVYLQDGVSGQIVVNRRDPRLISLDVTIGSDVTRQGNYQQLMNNKFSNITANNIAVQMGKITREGESDQDKSQLPDSYPKVLAQILQNYGLGSITRNETVNKIAEGKATANELDRYTNQIVEVFQNALSKKDPSNYSDSDLEIITRLLHENSTRLQQASDTETYMKVISKAEIENLLKKESGDPTLTGFSNFNQYSETLPASDVIRQFGLDYQYQNDSGEMIKPYLMSAAGQDRTLPFVYYVTTPMTEEIKNNAKIPLDRKVKAKLEAIANDPRRSDDDEIKTMAKELTAVGVYHELTPQYTYDQPRYGTQTDGKSSYAGMLRATYSTSNSQLSPGATIRAKGPNGEDFKIADWNGLAWTVSPQSSVDLPDWLKDRGRPEDQLNVEAELKPWKIVGDNRVTPPTNLPEPVRAFMAHHFQMSLDDITIQRVNSTDNDDSTATLIKFKPGEYNDTSEEGLNKIANKLGDTLKLKFTSHDNQSNIPRAIAAINSELTTRSGPMKTDVMMGRRPKAPVKPRKNNNSKHYTGKPSLGSTLRRGTRPK